MSSIKRFKEISSHDVASCGGKGASLGELMRAGFPFADGFVLTIDAFGIDTSQREQEVYAAYDALDAHYVAVRSSATKEDGIDDSFAGQFDTYLFVGREQLIDKIFECHASIDSDRIVAYCHSKGIERSEIKVAVVIQKMVNSDVAGVAFTANPITGDRNDIMIEAGWGLGEAVVAGIITPDNYIRSKQVQSISTKIIGQQHKKLILDIDHGGIKEEELESTVSSVQKLSDTHIQELARLCEKIEQHYEKPMDIEWAVEDGKIYILQARPITTLNIRTENTELAMLTSERSKKSYHYIHKRFRTPLYTHILRDAIRAYHNKDIPIDYACDVIYLNQDIATDSDQWNAHKKQWVQYFIENPKSINTLYDETYKTQEQIENYYESLLPQYHDMSKEDLMIFWKQYHTMMQKMLSTVLIPLYIEEWLETKIREYLEQKYPQEKVDYYYQMATTSQKVGVAFQEELSLLDIAITQKSGEDIQLLIQQHITEYAWTKNNSHDATFKTEQDVIEQLSYIKNPGDRKKELQSYFEEVSGVVDTLHRDFKDDILFNDILDTLQESIYFRSRRTERCYKNAYYMDVFFQKTAKYLELENYKDVFYLTLDEIVALLGEEKLAIHEVITNRKEGYVTFADANSITTLQGDDVLQKCISIKVMPENTSNIIEGQSAFTGTASGKVVVITHKDQLNKIQEGDILVTTATTVNYIPYLKKVQAIVTDEGGVLSHASVISRELKIPTIIGTMNATKILIDGDLVEVDASNGVVRILGKTDGPLGILTENRQKYMDREQSPFLSMSFDLAYGELLKKTTGFGFTKQLAYYKNNITTFYKLSDEFKASDEFFANILLHKPDRVAQWLEKEQQTHTWIEALRNETNIDTWLNTYHDILLYNTVIPYRLLSAMESYPHILEKIDESLIDAIQQCRGKSLYPEIMRTIFPKLCEKICPHINSNLCFLLSPTELTQLAIGDLSINNDTLAQREEGLYMYFDTHQHHYIPQAHDSLAPTISAQHIQGNCAFSGKVQGKVRIINTYAPEQVFSAGDILVSINTSPDLLPYIEKCAAIVSDEGGMMCHAAIVSRELQKPCIIGTKIATQILKDGDIIEVDADNGTVNIIHSSEILLSNFKEPWLKRRAGSYTFISCSYRGKQYYHSLQESLGISFPQTLFTHRRGTASFFVKREAFEKLGKMLAAWTKANPEQAIQRLQKLKDNTDIIMAMMDDYDGKILNEAEYKNFIAVFDRHLGYHNFMKKTVDFLDPTLLDEFLPHFHDARVYSESVYSRTEAFFRSFAQAVAQKESRNAQLLTCLTQEDIENYIADRTLPDDMVLQARYEASALFFEKGVEYIHTGSIVDIVEDDIKKSLQTDDTIQGYTAYPGKVTGIVKVVADPHNPGEFNAGDILVTGMTRPEYLPLVEKCAAFITDAGGILSHAAITARELKKPCIIGTEVATKILKTGDIISIDAKNGTIQVLEKIEDILDSYRNKSIKHMGTWEGIYPLDIGTWYPVEVSNNIYESFGIRGGFSVVCNCTKDIPIQQVYIKQQDLDIFAQRVQEIRETNLTGFADILGSIYDTIAGVKQYFISQDIDKIPAMSNEELAQTLIDYRSQVHKLSPYDQIVWRSEYYLDTQLHETIKSLGLQPNTEEYNKVLFAMITPSHPSTVMQEEQRLVQIAQSIKNGETSLDMGAIDLADSFGWLPAFIAGDERGPDYYKKILQQYIQKSTDDLIEKTEHYKQYSKKTQQTISDYTDQYGMSAQQAQICADYALAIDARNEAEYYLGFARRYLRPLFQTIAKRFGILEEELRLLYEEEVVDCLLGHKKIKDMLSLRKGDYTAYCYDEKTHQCHILDGEKVKEFVAYCTSTQQSAKKSSHVSASKGIAKGAARIVHGPHENYKVQKGDILITQSTTVDYLPAMKVCGAIITEVGGLTCHAAVVARELGIPCIVSYTGAMTKFSDGDFIEVDANTGQIRKNNYNN